MKKFLEKNKVALFYLIAGISAICGLQIFLLPYLINSIMRNTPVNIYELLITIALLLCGIGLLIKGLYCANDEIVKQKRFIKYLGNLLLFAVIVFVILIVLGLLQGLISQCLYLSTDLEYKMLKSIIELITVMIYICIQPLIFWCLAGVVYEKVLIIGVKRAFNTLKKGYWKLILLIIITTLIRYFVSFLGYLLLGLIFQLIVSVIVNVGTIVLALYWYRKPRKVEIYDEKE